MTNKVDAYFVALINEDGTITTLPEIPAEPLEANRAVTNYDVYQTAKQIVEEFESSILADKVARTVLSVLAPTTPAVSDNVKDALKKRGVTPEGM
jgi:hypothetical protein